MQRWAIDGPGPNGPMCPRARPTNPFGSMSQFPAQLCLLFAAQSFDGWYLLRTLTSHKWNHHLALPLSKGEPQYFLIKLAPLCICGTKGASPHPHPPIHIKVSPPRKIFWLHHCLYGFYLFSQNCLNAIESLLLFNPIWFELWDVWRGDDIWKFTVCRMAFATLTYKRTIHFAHSILFCNLLIAKWWKLYYHEKLGSFSFVLHGRHDGCLKLCFLRTAVVMLLRPWQLGPLQVQNFWGQGSSQATWRHCFLCRSVFPERR